MAAGTTNNAIVALLECEPFLTANEVADKAGLGRSTAAKALAALEHDHRVERDHTPSHAGRRPPARWSLAPVTRAPQTRPAAAQQPPSPGTDPGDPAPAGETGEQHVDGFPDRAEDARVADRISWRRHPGPDSPIDSGVVKDITIQGDGPVQIAKIRFADATLREFIAGHPVAIDRHQQYPYGHGDPDDATAGAPARDEEAARPAASGRRRAAGAAITADNPADRDQDRPPRLGRGELREQVLEQLRRRPDVEHTPTGLAKVLGRSSGAITNALVRLTLEGHAVESSARPRRYVLAATQAA